MIEGTDENQGKPLHNGVAADIRTGHDRSNKKRYHSKSVFS